MDTIGRIVYINLDRRPDRRAQIEAELDGWNLPYERFSAVDAGPTRGCVGCTASHSEVLRRAVEDGVSSLLVVEDDVTLLGTREEADKRIATAMSMYPDYDVLMLDYNLQQSTPPVYGVGRVGEASVASLYLVAGHYLQRLYNNVREASMLMYMYPSIHWLYINDQYWKRLQATDKWFYLEPRLGKQRDGYSDICDTVVTHTYAT
jgi:glycosyl transferase family 25